MEGRNLQQVKEVLEKFKGDDAFDSSQFPNTIETLMDLLNDNGFEFVEEDFNILESSKEIDLDGFPYIDEKIAIVPANIVVKLTVYHHEEWDFYIDDIK